MCVSSARNCCKFVYRTVNTFFLSINYHKFLAGTSLYYTSSKNNLYRSFNIIQDYKI